MASAASPQPTNLPTTATAKMTTSISPMPGEGAVVAGQADRNEEKRNQQSVADGMKAALHVGLVFRSGENVAQADMRP